MLDISHNENNVIQFTQPTKNYIYIPKDYQNHPNRMYFEMIKSSLRDDIGDDIYDRPLFAKDFKTQKRL